MCILTNKNFLKPIDKSVPVWNNIVRKRGEKPQEREETTMSKKIEIRYQCTVYLADGKHISQNEVCATPAIAMSRAKAWRAVGHKATAYKVVLDYLVGEMRMYPLD